MSAGAVVGLFTLILMGYLAAVFFLISKPLQPFARRLLIALTVVEIVLAGLYALTQQPGTPPFWFRFLDLDLEWTHDSAFSAGLLMAVGLVAFVNCFAIAPPKWWQRLYWCLLGAIFIYFSFDEYYAIHEYLFSLSPGQTGPWVIVYTAVGIGLVCVSLAVYWFGFRDQTALFARIVGGIALMAFGGIAVEAFNFMVLCSHVLFNLGELGLCHKVTLFEEFFELAGTTVVLAGVVSYAQAQLGEGRFRLAKRALAAGALWYVGLVVGTWTLPTLEARLAEPVQTEYLDGAMSLIGYRVSRDIVAPGDKLAVTLYWRADRPLPADYYLSAQVVTHPEVDSVAQETEPLGGWYGWTTSTWLPGVVMKSVVHFELPQDLHTPSSYWLTVQLWEPVDLDPLNWETAKYVSVSSTDRPLLPLLKPDTLILTGIPALSDAPLPQPQSEADYRFAEGFTLTGYWLPESATLGESLPLKFWWQTQTDVDADLIQFVHLFHSNGKDYIVYDQEPFGGSFPTLDWPARAKFVDEWSVPLPDDAPPGEYSVHIGMYAPDTGERLYVTDGQGQPVTDYSINLGTVILEP
jgi:hypothetical protein